MKKSILLLLLTFICSCNSKKESDKTEHEKKEIKREYLEQKFDNGISIQTEIYIYPNGDSIPNQQKIYKNQILDTLESHFYELQFEHLQNDKFKGKLTYFSNFDTIPKDKIFSRKIEFSFLQKNTDSTKYVDYKFTESNVLNFEYNDFNDLSLYGYIRESITMEAISNKNDMTRILERYILIDNKNPTENPFDIRLY
ncbi:hypothetical protein R3X25_15150 [Lutibacter sp. TH_r2]|uniref:hypothetical protein n=1 Tax=Lutibacter sp. TH_r2 TaxID=3082083 RepID=UPI00295347C3|nr:hypothetical protein [Lutibacter sp. TH_r2]MDV7188618.1 hypothetical protein [Lutibacter sp. TH_r2]